MDAAGFKTKTETSNFDCYEHTTREGIKKYNDKFYNKTSKTKQEINDLLALYNAKNNASLEKMQKNLEGIKYSDEFTRKQIWDQICASHLLEGKKVVIFKVDHNSHIDVDQYLFVEALGGQINQ